MNAYISGIGVFLPNEPVDNSTIEDVLGRVDGNRSRAKAFVLRSNGIKTRHYAIDPTTGEMTHTNRELTAEAVRALCVKTGFRMDELECLSCGTSAADQMMPNHAVMVHAELGAPACETISTAGVCCSGMTAFKYGYLNVLSGTTSTAVTTGSELASVALRSVNYESNDEASGDGADLERLKSNPAVAFEADFLRWMLSDGAAAVLITDKPRGGLVSLRIDWVEVLSMAHVSQPCMYLGAEKQEDGSLLGWRQVGNLQEALDRGYFQLKQDVRQLGNQVSELGGEALDIVRKRHDLAPAMYDWFLPHLSSEYFRKPTEQGLREHGFDIPAEKWFTNLSAKGNTGSASVFIILEELLDSGRLRPGQKILCLVPESSHFTYSYMQLTVV